MGGARVRVMSADYAPVDTYAAEEDGVELQEPPSHEVSPSSPSQVQADTASLTLQSPAESREPLPEVSESVPLTVAEEDEDEEEEDYDYPTSGRASYDNMSSSIPLLPVPFGRHVGRMNVCWERRDRNGRRKFSCVIGPCWECVTFVTFPLIIFVSMTCFLAFLPGWQNPITWGAYLVLGATVVGLWKTCTTDPGIMPRSTTAKGRGWRWCAAAQSFHAPGVSYDPEAKVLVKNLDHICPWTGTVIGDSNLCYFHMFVSALPVLCIVVILVAMLGTKAIADRNRKFCTGTWKHGRCIGGTSIPPFPTSTPDAPDESEVDQLVNITMNITTTAVSALVDLVNKTR